MDAVTSPRSGNGMKVLAWVALACVSMLVGMSAGCRARKPKAPLPDAEVVKRFNQVYFNSGVIQRTTWLGVRLGQNPCDLWTMQEIICEIQPDVIVETGTWLGGSALYYAMVQEHLHRGGKVVTIDLKDYGLDRLAKFPAYRKNVVFILGDSVAPETLDRVRAEIGPKAKVMVTLDSLHTKEHVLKELRLYSRFVSPGSYLVVQDTNIHGHPVHPNFPEGPMEALMEFLKGRDDFVIDSSREKLLLTFYPNGYLKRIK